MDEIIRTYMYYTESLNKEVDRVDELLTKLWQLPAPDLTIEARIMLRYFLADVKSLARLLEKNTHEYNMMQNRKKKGFIKKILKK